MEIHSGWETLGHALGDAFMDRPEVKRYLNTRPQMLSMLLNCDVRTYENLATKEFTVFIRPKSQLYYDMLMDAERKGEIEKWISQVIKANIVIVEPTTN